MSETRASLWLIVLFGLRCIAPILLTIAIGYLMNWLVDKWELEAAEQMQVETEQKKGGQKRPLPTSYLTRDTKPLPLPCWLIKGCDPARRLECPAAKQREKPCWVARMQAANGTLPEECPSCPVYEAVA